MAPILATLDIADHALIALVVAVVARLAKAKRLVEGHLARKS